jgi:hypothetical protein
MQTVLINYADKRFYRAQRWNRKTALEIGGFNRVIRWRRRHLDRDFYNRNRKILEIERGAGVYLWKPYITVATLLNELSPGDILFYCDSGSHFIASVRPLIDLCCSHPEKPLLFFTLADIRTTRRWTKRDCFFYMGLDTPPYLDFPQNAGGYFMCRKSPASVELFQEWLRYAQDPRILTDIPNECGLPNYPEFVEHRHDQSILSLLVRKHDLPTMPDISQWGNDYRSPDIGQIINLTRWAE